MAMPDSIKSFIDGNNWLLAKSMPKHWYVARVDGNARDFNVFATYIHKNGELRKWGSYGYLYLDIGEFTYWTLTNSEGEVTLINRAELQSITSETGSIDELKKCPNCKRLTPSSQYKKFEVRTNGKVKTFWRCPVCEEFKLAAKRAALKSTIK